MAARPRSIRLRIEVDWQERLLDIQADSAAWTFGATGGPFAHFSWQQFETATEWLKTAPDWSLKVFSDQRAALVLGKVDNGLIGFQVPDKAQGVRGFWGGLVFSPDTLIWIFAEIEKLRPEDYALDEGRTQLDQLVAQDGYAVAEVQPLKPRDGAVYAASALRDITVDEFKWTLFFSSDAAGLRLCALDSAESFFGWESILNFVKFLGSASAYSTFCIADDSQATVDEPGPCALYVVILRGCALLGYRGVGGAWSGILDPTTMRQVVGEMRRHYECWNGSVL